MIALPGQNELEYAAKNYTVGQVQPHAEACSAGKCWSYIHCFFGQPGGDNSVPAPVCAREILKSLRAVEGE